MANIKIRETIHHGDYRNVRTVEVYAVNKVTVDAVLQSSAYCYGTFTDTDRHREMLAELVEDLKAGRVNRSIGWSTFEVV
jgi:hypothetical protein